MALIGCIAGFLLLFAAIVFYALRQGRDVKAGVKIPFAAFFFETKDRKDAPTTRKRA